MTVALENKRQRFCAERERLSDSNTSLSQAYSAECDVFHYAARAEIARDFLSLQPPRTANQHFRLGVFCFFEPVC